VVRIADIIGYLNHDIDDAVRGNVISEEDIPRHLRDNLGHSVSDRIDTMVRGVIWSTLQSGRMELGCGEELEAHMLEMRDFLYVRVYESPVVHADFIKCSKIIEDLYGYFLKNPDAFLKETDRNDFHDDPVACVRDFIAGMTDRYAFSLFERIFLPMPWSIPV